MTSNIQRKQLESLRKRWQLNSGISQRNRVAYVLKRSRDNYVRVVGNERGLMQYQAECLEYAEGIGNHHEVAKFERNRVTAIIDKAFANFPDDHVVSKLVEDFKGEIYGIFRRKPKEVLDVLETDLAPVAEIVLTKEQVSIQTMITKGVGLFKHWSLDAAAKSKKYAVVTAASALLFTTSPANAGPAFCGPASMLDPSKEKLQSITVQGGLGEEIDISEGYYMPIMRYPFNPSTISSGFGYRNAPCLGCSSYHQGLDFATDYGAKIPAVIAGTVTEVDYDYDLGNYVTVDAGYGMETIYAHLSSALVSVGDKVKLSQIIGKVGTTGKTSGAHLHLAVRMYGELVDPLAVLKSYSK